MTTFEKITEKKPNMVLFPNTDEEITGYFVNERINKTSIPNGWNLYEFRTNTSGQKSTIEPSVRVNFGGSFLTQMLINFPDKNDEYRNIKGKCKIIKNR